MTWRRTTNLHFLSAPRWGWLILTKQKITPTPITKYNITQNIFSRSYQQNEPKFIHVKLFWEQKAEVLLFLEQFSFPTQNSKPIVKSTKSFEQWLKPRPNLRVTCLGVSIEHWRQQTINKRITILHTGTGRYIYSS